SQGGFAKGSYHCSRTVNLTLLGKPGAALQELKTLEGLREGAIGKQFTRNQIWLDIVAADVYMGLEQYEEATKHAKRALDGCRDINSVSNLAVIVDIHGRLLQSPYKAESDLCGLGDMLQEALTKQLE